jgi:nucleolar protein 14
VDALFSSMAKKRQRDQHILKKKEQKKEHAPNLFERLSNKKRFDVLGRKTKGDTRNLSRLRTAATEKVSITAVPGISMHIRHAHACHPAITHPQLPTSPWTVVLQRKSTLLVEYKQLRKSNAFIDRRFGGGRA